MLRLITYNIRAGRGLDGRRSLERIADVLRPEMPAVVALQEVDCNRSRSGRTDQAAELARMLGLASLFCPSLTIDGGAYGNAILSPAGAELERHAALPYLVGSEPRSAMAVRVRSGPCDANIINTHLSYRRRERSAQIDHLLSPLWLGHDKFRSHTVLLGDLNCTPRDGGFRYLRRALRDAPDCVQLLPRKTWPARRPLVRIDHVLVTHDWRIVAARVPLRRIARVASDHLPLVVDLEPL